MAANEFVRVMRACVALRPAPQRCFKGCSVMCLRLSLCDPDYSEFYRQWPNAHAAPTPRPHGAV